jgi:hypothetical protein
VSERLSFSFSDAARGVHVFGRSNGPCLVLRSAAATLTAAGDLAASAAGFDVSIEGHEDVVLELLGDPIEFGDRGRVWLCRGGAVISDGAPAGLRRTIWAEFGPDLAFAVRSSGRTGDHGAEPCEAWVARGAPLEAAAADDPRLSTTYAADESILRAGIELWEHDPDHEPGKPHDRFRAVRLAGETVATGALDDETTVAFLAWHHDGATGIGSYTIERAP